MPRRTAAAIARARSQVAQWADQHHSADFTDLVRTYLGPDLATLRTHPELLEQALGFAIIATTPAGDTLVDRFRATQPSNPRVVRDALDTLSCRRFTALHVRSVEPGRGLHVRDALSDECHYLREESGSHTLEEGMWVVGSIGRVDGGWELLGDARVVGPTTAIHIVQALLTPDRPEVRAIEAYHRAQRPPRLVNSDGHAIVPLDLLLDCTWSQVTDQASGWEDAGVEEDAIVLLGEVTPRVGRVVRARLEPSGRRVLLTVNSVEREAELLERLGHPDVIEREAHTSRLPKNDVEGQEMIFDMYQQTIREGSDPQEDFHLHRARAWADEPIPALDGLTPRQALEAGRLPEVRALAPDDPAALATLGLSW